MVGVAEALARAQFAHAAADAPPQQGTQGGAIGVAQCGVFSYEDWLSRYTESAEEFAEILRLRMLLRQGLIMQDWSRLGLSGLKREMPSLL